MSDNSLAREILAGVLAHLETHGHLVNKEDIKTGFLVAAIEKTLADPVMPHRMLEAIKSETR